MKTLSAQNPLFGPLDLPAAVLDRAFMGLYAQACSNARRAARAAVTLAPLILLLVGSCKTSQLPGAYGSSAGPEQFRTALFPDRVNFTGMSYYPAEGYVARARKYVSGAPGALEMLTDREVSWLFGPPALRRNDGGALVWQYRAGACVVDFYFYGGDGADKAVSYVDVHAADGADAAGRQQRRCLDRVIGSGDLSSSRA